MTTANKITLIRVGMIPLFMIAAMLSLNILALVFFIIASLTDFVDGYVARKYNQVTDFGKFIDPLADKLLVVAAILMFIEWGKMPAWAGMIVIAREFAVTFLRLIAVESGVVIAAGMSGKIKTASTLVGICIMFLPLASFELIPGVLTLNTLIVAVIVLTTLWSGAEYFCKNWKLLIQSK